MFYLVIPTTGRDVGNNIQVNDVNDITQVCGYVGILNVVSASMTSQGRFYTIQLLENNKTSYRHMRYV